MIDRVSFDRQINQIRSRYSKLVNNKEVSIPKNPKKAPQLSIKEGDNALFTTPIRTREKYFEDQFVSFSKSKDHPEGVQNLKAKRFGVENVKMEIDPIQPNFQEERMCITSRKQTSGMNQLNARLTEKEKKLIERMKQNQKLLKRSKDLREGESKGKNTQGNQKKVSAGKQESYFDYVRAKDKENLMLGKKLLLQFPRSNENVEEIKTERQKQNGQIISGLSSDKIKAKRGFEFQKTALQEKENFRSKDSMKKEKQEDQFTKFIQQPSKSLYHNPLLQEESKKNQDDFLKNGDTKIKSVFENTAKIQERIKALLSLH